MKIFKYSLIAIVLLSGATSCKKDPPTLDDQRPPIPVIVTNYQALRPGYTVYASKGAGGTFNFNLEIPSSSGRSIREITRIIASTSTANLITGAGSSYNAAPIAGTGNKVTFASSITEWMAKTGRPDPAANAELATQFYLKITLDDNSTLITEPLRVFVIP